MSASLAQTLLAIGNPRVLVVGDLMLDRYVWGAVERISPEAPVPVVRIEREEERLGGAANVALNLAALGAEPLLISVIGDDASGGRFYMSEASSGNSVVAQYDAATWTVLGDTAATPATTNGGCELWKNDTFLLLFEQGAPDAVWCFRLIQLANDVGVTAASSD